jgi:hypothetical protein
VLYFHEWRPSYELQSQRKKSWRFWGERYIHLLIPASGRLVPWNRFDCKWTDPLLRISFILLRATPYVFTRNIAKALLPSWRCMLVNIEISFGLTARYECILYVNLRRSHELWTCKGF